MNSKRKRGSKFAKKTTAKESPDSPRGQVQSGVKKRPFASPASSETLSKDEVTGKPERVCNQEDNTKSVNVRSQNRRVKTIMGYTSSWK